MVLIGFKGCGKSTLGRQWADELGRPCNDTDDVLRELEGSGRSCRQIYEESGEEYFRKWEIKVARKLSAKRGCVIATGGGFPLQQACREALAVNGRWVYLKADPEVLYERLFAKEPPVICPTQEKFERLYWQRHRQYEELADVIVEMPYE